MEPGNLLDLGERFNQPRGNTFRKITITRAHVPEELRLAMAVEAMNETLGPEGFVPSALVFGERPLFWAPRIGNLPRPDLAESAKIAEEARKQMSSKIANVRLRRALRHRGPESAQSIYKHGDPFII